MSRDIIGEGIFDLRFCEDYIYFIFLIVETAYLIIIFGVMHLTAEVSPSTHLYKSQSLLADFLSHLTLPKLKVKVALPWNSKYEAN